MLRPAVALLFLAGVAASGCVGSEGEPEQVWFLPPLTYGSMITIGDSVYVVEGPEERTDAFGVRRPLAAVTSVHDTFFLDPESRADVLRPWPHVGPHRHGTSAAAAPPWLFLLPGREFTDGARWTQFFAGAHHDARARLHDGKLTIDLSNTQAHYRATYHIQGSNPTWEDFRGIDIDFVRDVGVKHANDTYRVRVIPDPEGAPLALGDGSLELPSPIERPTWPIADPERPIALTLSRALERLGEEQTYADFARQPGVWPSHISYREDVYLDPRGPTWNLLLQSEARHALEARVTGLDRVPAQPLLVADVSASGLNYTYRPPLASLADLFDIVEALHEDLGERRVTWIEWAPGTIWGPGALIVFGHGQDARYCYMHPERGAAETCDVGPPPRY